MRISDAVLAALVLVQTEAIRCYWCSGVGKDRDCELHPHHVHLDTGSINCQSSFCLSAKVIDPESRLVQSFARLCDNVKRSNVCIRDSKLLTCYHSCQSNLCNIINPDPAHLPLISYVTETRNEFKKEMQVKQPPVQLKTPIKSIDAQRNFWKQTPNVSKITKTPGNVRSAVEEFNEHLEESNGWVRLNKLESKDNTFREIAKSKENRKVVSLVHNALAALQAPKQYKPFLKKIKLYTAEKFSEKEKAKNSSSKREERPMSTVKNNLAVETTSEKHSTVSFDVSRGITEQNRETKQNFDVKKNTLKQDDKVYLGSTSTKNTADSVYFKSKNVTNNVLTIPANISSELFLDVVASGDEIWEIMDINVTASISSPMLPNQSDRKKAMLQQNDMLKMNTNAIKLPMSKDGNAVKKVLLTDGIFSSLTKGNLTKENMDKNGQQKQYTDVVSENSGDTKLCFQLISMVITLTASVVMYISTN